MWKLKHWVRLPIPHPWTTFLDNWLMINWQQQQPFKILYYYTTLNRPQTGGTKNTHVTTPNGQPWTTVGKTPANVWISDGRMDTRLCIMGHNKQTNGLIQMIRDWFGSAIVTWLTSIWIILNNNSKTDFLKKNFYVNVSMKVTGEITKRMLKMVL